MTKLIHGNFEGNITIKNGEVPDTALKALKFMDKYFPQGSRNGESGEVIETIRTALKKSAQADGLVKALEHAHNSLKWWRSEYPDRYSQADDEMDVQINAALHQFSAMEILDENHDTQPWRPRQMDKIRSCRFGREDED